MKSEDLSRVLSVIWVFFSVSEVLLLLNVSTFWQICSYVNSSKIISQKKTGCIFNVDKVADLLENVSRYNTMTSTLAPHVLLPATVHLIDLTHKRLLLFQCFLQYHSCHLKGTEWLVTSGNSQVVHTFILLVLTDFLYIYVYIFG